MSFDFFFIDHSFVILYKINAFLQYSLIFLTILFHIKNETSEFINAETI